MDEWTIIASSKSYIGQQTRKGAGDSHARWLSEMPVRGQPTRMESALRKLLSAGHHGRALAAPAEGAGGSK